MRPIDADKILYTKDNSGLKDFEYAIRAQIENLPTVDHVGRSETELKPCPFCGKQVNQPSVYLGNDNRFYVSVSCKDCGVEIKKASFGAGVKSINEAAKEAVEKWNVRLASEI